MAGETGVTSPQVAERRQLLAVVYVFDGFAGGEQRLVVQDQMPASAQGMIEMQLQAVPKRTLVDSGPGLLVYSTYQDARYAASVVTTLATHVALHEVTPLVDAMGNASGADGEVLTASSGARYAPVPGGMSEIVKQ